MITMLCFLAVSCINFVVGPSGIFSTASYQRVCCSAQKYGVVKTSCIQRICAPCFAASSIIARCFSIFFCLISSIDASVGAAFFAWINPHLTVRGINTPSFRLQVKVSALITFESCRLWWRKCHYPKISHRRRAKPNKPRVIIERLQEWHYHAKTRENWPCPSQGTTD